MRTLFHPFLPNGLVGDPLLLVELADLGRSLLLDLGDLRNVPARKLLRVDRVVVTHTHLDHFIGFDHLLRLSLGREKELVLTGPAGLIENVEGKLRGYAWNLIESYPVRLRVEEVVGERVRSAGFSGAGRLRPEPLPERPFAGTIHVEDAYAIQVAQLQHGIPVLGIALREREHLSVDKDRLQALGLTPGKWLHDLKQAVRSGLGPQDLVLATDVQGATRPYSRAELAAELLRRKPGQEIAYLTDIAASEENLNRAAELARGVHLLVCEAVFLHRDEALARKRNHLTARQAGELARAAGAQRLAVFHVSPRYEGAEQELVEEAAKYFGGDVFRLSTGPRVL